MNRKELLLLAVGVFFTMIAFAVNAVVKIQNEQYVNEEINSVNIPAITIHSKVFNKLQEKVE